jgi:hypothetical protein
MQLVYYVSEQMTLQVREGAVGVSEYAVKITPWELNYECSNEWLSE